MRTLFWISIFCLLLLVMKKCHHCHREFASLSTHRPFCKAATQATSVALQKRAREADDPSDIPAKLSRGLETDVSRARQNPHRNQNMSAPHTVAEVCSNASRLCGARLIISLCSFHHHRLLSLVSNLLHFLLAAPRHLRCWLRPGPDVAATCPLGFTTLCRVTRPTFLLTFVLSLRSCHRTTCHRTTYRPFGRLHSRPTKSGQSQTYLGCIAFTQHGRHRIPMTRQRWRMFAMPRVLQRPQHPYASLRLTLCTTPIHPIHLHHF
jgi:hypothetical protein